MANLTEKVRAVKVTVRKGVERVCEKTTTTRLLRFGRGNAKLKDPNILTFSLPAGWSCPGATACLSKANRVTGKVKDGHETSFRCYAATMEARHRSVRDARWHNVQLLRRCTNLEEMVQLILDSLSPFAGVVRIHDSGDFFSQAYFDSWCDVARCRPWTRYYCYTKSLPFWVARLGDVPANLVLTASKGGRFDELIHRHGLRYAQVVFSEREAAERGLELDHDDSFAMDPSAPSFALLLHGTQPLGTPAAKALASLKAAGEWGYGEYAEQIRTARREGGGS
jgi:hypothetical protein